MKRTVKRHIQTPPYDLLLAPIAVLLCYYLVVFQLQHSEEVREELSHKNEISQLIAMESADSMIQYVPANPPTTLVHRSSVSSPMYLRVARNSFQYGALLERSVETFQELDYNGIRLASDKPVSTFSVDVDTGGFANIRRILNSGQLPEKNQIRVEEIINYFSYSYPKPESKEQPFSITTGITSSPWNKGSHLLRIGLLGFAEEIKQLPNSNIVFLVDVSGSMDDENKLPLAKRALRLLSNNLRDDDRISLVTYAGNTQVILSSIAGSEKDTIRMAIGKLNARGATAGESGLKLAYNEALKGFIEGGNNRIIMMTDGDFNVGLNSVDEMKRLVEKKRKSGVFLSTVGFGTGNYREDMMEQMADHGNGIYFYIDNYAEAVRVFERNLRSNLFAIAKDVKIQVEFNPSVVSEYRLVGYENRKLNKEDFNNDKVDAGDVGQGHSVTALYEITYVENSGKIEPIRYKNEVDSVSKHSDEVAFIKLRYKPKDSNESRLLEKPVVNKTLAYEAIDLDFKKVFLAASFGELLRESKYINRKFNYSRLTKMIENLSENDDDIFELKELVLLASTIE